MLCTGQQEVMLCTWTAWGNTLRRNSTRQCFAQEKHEAVLCTGTAQGNALHRNSMRQCFAQEQHEAMLCTVWWYVLLRGSTRIYCAQECWHKEKSDKQKKRHKNNLKTCYFSSYFSSQKEENLHTPLPRWYTSPHTHTHTLNSPCPYGDWR